MDEVNQIIYPQAEERQIEYVIYTASLLEQFYIGDPARLKQILMNCCPMRLNSHGQEEGFRFRLRSRNGPTDFPICGSR